MRGLSNNKEIGGGELQTAGVSQDLEELETMKRVNCIVLQFLQCN